MSVKLRLGADQALEEGLTFHREDLVDRLLALSALLCFDELATEFKGLLWSVLQL